MKTLDPEGVYNKIEEFLLNQIEFKYYVSKMNVNLGDSSAITAVINKMIIPTDNIALIHRKNDELVFSLSEEVKSIVVFDRDMSVDTIDISERGSINSKYIHETRQKGVSAEYGFIYNIPAPDESYDVVANFTLFAEEYSEFALREMKRVVRDKGKLIVLTKKDELTIIEKKRI